MEIFNNISGEGKGEQCKGYEEQINHYYRSFL